MWLHIKGVQKCNYVNCYFNYAFRPRDLSFPHCIHSQLYPLKIKRSLPNTKLYHSISFAFSFYCSIVHMTPVVDTLPCNNNQLANNQIMVIWVFGY